MAAKTILITGASGGLGAALARAHARAGVTLLLWGRDEMRLNQTAQQCRALGAVCIRAAFDIRDIDGVVARLGVSDAQTPIDLAIFNAGLGGSVTNEARAEAPQAARATAEVNFVSPVVGASLMADAMARRGAGQIVLVGSIAESYPLPMAPTYAATKAGLAMFAEALGIRMAKHNVRVTLVSPGFIDTAMSRQVPQAKPFLMTADAAAAIITRKIAKGARRIVVPWQFAVIRAVTNLLPRALVRAILPRMSSASDLKPQPALSAFLASRPWAVRTIQILRWLFPLILLGYVGYRLSELGWRDMWAARPANLGFYVLLVAQFFLQPLGDFLVYRNLWGTGNAPPLSVILRKRFLNSAMLDYSGEVFFYFWAQARLKLPPGMLIHAIKDSNVLSAGAGLAMVWVMALMLLATGGLHIPQSVAGNLWLYIALGSLPLWLCAVLVLAHRKVTVLSRGQIAATFAIHFLRSLSVLTVEFGLWLLSGALPTAVACLQFVALRLVVTRLPMVPNKDLIYVGAGIAAAGMVNLPVAPVATVLVILAAADLGLVTLVAGLPWALEQLRGKKA